MMNAIEATSLTKVFTRKLTQKVQALRDVSFSVTEGEVLGFIGPNGAGKSTTIKILLGLLRPDAGESLFFGRKSADPAARSRVGYLAENPAYYDYMTPRELLEFVGLNFGVPAARLGEKVGEVLRLIELEKAADRPIRSLSKGMVQRIGLGQTLVHDPDLYILDEPMSGLDPLGRSLVADIILDLKKRGKTVFFSTHIIHDVERICDKAVILLDGEVRFSGAIRSVIDESFASYEVVLRDRLSEAAAAGEPDVKVVQESGHSKVSVPKHSLAKFLQDISDKAEILSVEPERMTLEQIFLELVKGRQKG
jgi:ABC-2 type transport system ATP-binding protein